MIIVSLHLSGWNPGRDIHSAIEDRAYTGPTRFLKHIEKEVMPFLEGNYRVSQEKVITGWPRFGLLPDYALLIKLGLFSGYIKNSVAGHGSIPEILYKRVGAFIKENPDLVAKYYIELGTEEDQRYAEFNGLKKILNGNAHSGFIWKVSILKDVDHGDTFTIGLKEGLIFYFSN